MRPVILVYLALSTALWGCDEAHSPNPLAQAALGVEAEREAPGRSSSGEAVSAPSPAARQSFPSEASAARAPKASAPATPQASAPAPRAAGEDAQASLSLETHLGAEGDSLAARWRVTNRGSAPIYLVTQVPSFQRGGQVPAPGAIYRRAEDETLYLTKRLWRIPAAVDALVPALPYLIRLDPGQSHLGGVRIPAAIRESYPYQDGYRAAQIERLVISFGYFASATPCAEYPGLYQVPYSALDQQRYLTSEPLAARLEVR